ncbi:succinate-semialdehyde dehydrogenase/glutarate-semialdehyde dehydrogenase [Brevibacterium sanguinis]|uniref:Succinate-semialdehyde dehydrogenase/glutarate-semialdehyde dehydrogenase n=2 Tax=Brevibacterium TaxID=1696 RepID=A0A366IN31_9MICO|nr:MULTISPECIES: NAD-dependent succinate-semialdehyde dehydrogenase [Brevibacterium]RBP68090.1 succinate-semialdehyde dehydrogenase/glutarate-semialdehyde dehydrogenase [Brevibacterium sanguinis]RBP74493.1 succinate-semialdehyde dehydrogenase/glutarate-semialdehyde dehydrogenase [Brevibacterium celere]
MYQTINPATDELLDEYPTATDAEVSAAIERSHRAYTHWRRVPLDRRISAIRAVATAIRERTDELALIITQEMGKRIDESRGELQLVAEIFDYYASAAPELLADDTIAIDGATAYVRKEPIGVILGIMPWNFPYYQVARLAAPNLVLGNTILLKHASNCPRAAAAIEEIIVSSGVPSDAFINVYASSSQIPDILADDRVCGVSLTGSEKAGLAVAELAGRNLKKAVLELGGSDPFIVLDTEDIAETAEIAVASRMGNNGQACNAPKRMIVMDEIYDEFVAEFAARLERYGPGDPSDPKTLLPPLSSRAAAEEFVAQVNDAVEKGATLHCGGTQLDGPGAYVSPALLTGVKPGMHAYDDEIFGPAAVVFRVRDEDEAISLANDTKFGLGASVYSVDRKRAERVAEQLEAGMVYINAPGGSRAELPFGGVKRSGIGRELGPLGIEEFMNKKTIMIR